MSPEARAILFDLDDTLYPARRFVFSGFAAVARRLAETDGLDARTVFALLRAAWKGPRRGRELQACVDHFALPSSRVEGLLDVMREHAPAMRLPGSSVRTLRALRARWRTGIVTNGVPAMQARKVAALGVGALVDTVVFAHEHGTCLGKPDRVPFVVALERLGVAPDQAVFVGDNEENDIAGASGIGMRTILVNAFRLKPEATWRDGERVNDQPRAASCQPPAASSVSPWLRGPSRAHFVIDSISDLPRVIAEITA